MISKNLTSQLRLKHYPQSVRYDGVHGKGCSKAYGHTELKSLVDPDKLTVVTFSVIPQLKPVNPPRHKIILEDSAIKELKLADPDPGRTINLIIGNRVWRAASSDIQLKLTLTKTLFGWSVARLLGNNDLPQVLHTQPQEDQLQWSLKRLWELDQVPETPSLSNTDTQIVAEFEETHSRNAHS